MGCDDSSVQLYTITSSSLTPAKTFKPSSSSPTVVSFSKTSNLAVGLANGKIVVYAISGSASDAKLVTDRWSAHTGRVTSIAWNEAGTHAASGALDTNVYVWSLAKAGDRVAAQNAHKDGVYGVSWVAGGRVASTGGDNSVKLCSTQPLTDGRWWR